MIIDALIAPFTEFEFMRRALAAVIALSLGGAPIGVFLMLRRMSLVGDAMAVGQRRPGGRRILVVQGACGPDVVSPPHRLVQLHGRAQDR